MQFLSIGLNGDVEDVLQQISGELQQLRSRKIDYEVNEIDTEGSTSIVCSVDDSTELEDKSAQTFKVLKTHVSNALADYIIKQYEDRLIGRIINSNYCYFNASEKKEIMALAVKTIKNDDRSFLNSLFHIRRRNIIIRKLLDYFENNNSVILDGFVNFRLKDYTKDLEEVVDKAVDDFLMEREYKEFIRLLRYFVEIQDPKFDIIHVIVSYDSKYKLLDDKKREITNECIQDFVNEISEGDINYDDLLVSSLITLAPKKVIIHCTGQFKNKELLDTINNVFTGKVTICKGCDICLVNLPKSEYKS